MSEREVFHLKCWFEGHVQGVGFRYTTSRIAREFEVNGQVENLSDGRVLLEAEGSESEVRAFQAEVADQMESFIRESEIRTEQRAPRFQGFQIAG